MWVKYVIIYKSNSEVDNNKYGCYNMKMQKYYTGIGSRLTPLYVCDLMTEAAEQLEQKGYILRSGGADGADKAFEDGVGFEKNKEIWLPWRNFEKNPSMLFPSLKAFDMASKIHPVWPKLTQGAQRLHARNCHQVLGKDLNTKSEFLICWTENGITKGGTATAIKLALNNSIPVLNLGKWDNEASMRDALEDFSILNGEYNDL